MTIGPSALRCLRDMLADPYEVDILCERDSCYCGDRPIARSTVTELLRCMAIKYAGDGMKLERYVVNENYAAWILARPTLADEIERAVYRSKPFSVQNGQIVLVPAAPSNQEPGQ